jgi:hypothetical protein
LTDSKDKVRQTALASLDCMVQQTGMEPLVPYLAAALLADGQALLRKVRHRSPQKRALPGRTDAHTPIRCVLAHARVQRSV